MARAAMAQGTICALRREIARIEGTLPARLAAPGEDGLVLRRGLSAAYGAVTQGPDSGLVETGAPGFDTALGGGVPRAALTEVHGGQTRDAGAAAGFALALVALSRAGSRSEKVRGQGAVCWIGMKDVFREAGSPYAPGFAASFGLRAGDLLFSAVRDLGDALWVAEEAARLDDFAAVVLELRGNPARLDLTATRRLHRRAQVAGRPVILLREAARAEPTAAPVRFVVSAAPAVPRATLSGPLDDSIGHPVFTVAIGKSRTALQEIFVLEWNPDAFSLREIAPAPSRALVPAPVHRPHPAPAIGAVVALRPGGATPAAGGQPPREEHPAPRRPRRTG